LVFDHFTAEGQQAEQGGVKQRKFKVEG